MSNPIVSVAGVTVLGLRDAHTPMILSARRTTRRIEPPASEHRYTGGDTEYNAGFAAGRSFCDARGGYLPPGFSVPPSIVEHDPNWRRGFDAALKRCPRIFEGGTMKANQLQTTRRRLGGPAPLPARAELPPTAVRRIEPPASEHRYIGGDTAYNAGFAAGRSFCDAHGGQLELGSPVPYPSEAHDPDWRRGFDAAIKRCPKVEPALARYNSNVMGEVSGTLHVLDFVR